MLTPLAVKIAARLALIGFAVASTLELRKFNFLKTRVTSFKDNHIFSQRELPNFISQNTLSPKRLDFIKHLRNVGEGKRLTLEIATDIREWVHSQQNGRTYDWEAYKNDNESEDPETLLSNLYAGRHTHCRQ